MGKNYQGGSGHKKFARKHNQSSNNNKLRVSEDEAELYSIVTKVLGNNMFHCYCIDGVVRLGHIRGKFTGRGKRDNKIECGKWILVGLREWDIQTDKTAISDKKVKEKLQQCDLMEVYSDTDKFRLKETVVENWNRLESNDVTKTVIDIKTDDDIVFGSDRDFERDKLIEQMKQSNMEKITLKLGETNEEQTNEDDEINIDDI
jgi:translation initiation factor 1A